MQEKKYLDLSGLHYLHEKWLSILNNRIPAAIPSQEGQVLTVQNGKWVAKNLPSDDYSAVIFILDKIEEGLEIQITNQLNPSIVLTGLTNTEGKAYIAVDQAGIYNVKYLISSGIIDGPKIVNVATLGATYEINIKLRQGVTYTAVIDLSNSNPVSCVTYQDDAIGISKNSSLWDEKGLFSDIRPCVLMNGEVAYYLQKGDFSLKEDGTPANLNGTDGDFCIEIPKFAYKIKRTAADDGTPRLIVSVSTDESKVALDPDYCYNAFGYATEGDCTHIYIGAYKSQAENNISLMNSLPNVSYNLAHLNGAYQGVTNKNMDIYTYNLPSYYVYTALSCLCIIRSGSLNGQQAFGNGHSNSSSLTTEENRMTGKTAASGMFSKGYESQGHIKVFGIEDLWSSTYDIVSGCRVNDSGDFVTYFPATSPEAGHVTPYNFSAKVAAKYPSDIIGTNEAGFLGSTTNGSSSTFFCNQYFYDKGAWCAFGGLGSGVGNGPFCYNISSTNNTYTHGVMATRLCYYKLEGGTPANANSTES